MLRSFQCPSCGFEKDDVLVADSRTRYQCGCCQTMMEVKFEACTNIVGIKPRSDQAEFHRGFADDPEEEARGMRRFLAKEETAGRLSKETLKLKVSDVLIPDDKVVPSEQEWADDTRRSDQKDMQQELKVCDSGLDDINRAIHNLSPETVREQMRDFRAKQEVTRKGFSGVDVRDAGEVQVQP